MSNYSSNLKQARSQIIALGIMTVPMGLILLQPDAGSALVFGGFLFLFYREGLPSTYYLVGAFSAAMLLIGFVYPVHSTALGMSWLAMIIFAFSLKARMWWLLLALGASIAGYIAYQDENSTYFYPIIIATGSLLLIYLGAMYREKKTRMASLVMAAMVYGAVISLGASYVFNSVLKRHQQNRITSWLNPSQADADAKYNLIQSKMAIGSGGATGKGFLNGTMTKLDFVPEQYTDFIFCTVGEEQGFIGSFSIIILFLLLLLRIISVAAY